MNRWLTDLFQETRKSFPALEPSNSGGYILFDNAAGTQLPRVAIEGVANHLTRSNAQKGPVFARQEGMQQTIYSLRAACADFMGSAAHQVALGLNATSLTALVAHHLGRDLVPGDLIVTTQIDHMSNVLPWVELQGRGIEVVSVPITPGGTLDMAAYRSLLERKPRLVTCGWVSNATGTVVDVAEMARLAHGAGALIFVDCVAGAPHLPMAVTEWDVDFAVCSAYKIFGPHLGMLYVNPARLGQWQLGELVGRQAGQYDLGTAMVAKLELGTQNHEGVAGFLGTLAYLEELGRAVATRQSSAPVSTRRERLVTAMTAIATYEQGLATRLRQAVAAVSGATIYGQTAVPILSFNVEGHTPRDVARYLESHGVEARTGNYLAIPQMTYLASDFGGEAVRVSLVHYNLTEEIDRFATLIGAL